MLPEKNITIAQIANDLGENKYDLASLCTSSNINMFSKKKPVRGSWPQSSSGHYGIVIQTYVWGSSNNWIYEKPTSEFRIGDFRNYKKEAFALMAMREGVILPKYNIMKGDVSFYMFKSAGGDLLTERDLGLDGYCLGIELRNANGDVRQYIGDDLGVVVIPLSSATFSQARWQGELSYQLFLANGNYLLASKFSVYSGIINGHKYTDRGTFKVVNESTADIVTTAIKGNCYSGSTGFVDPLTTFSFDGENMGSENALKTNGDITIRFKAKSLSSDSIIIIPQFKVRGLYDDFVYSASTIYNASNTSVVSNVLCTAAGIEYCVRIPKALNRQNGTIINVYNQLCNGHIIIADNNETYGSTMFLAKIN